jgi:hypothetical protein
MVEDNYSAGRVGNGRSEVVPAAVLTLAGGDIG